MLAAALSAVALAASRPVSVSGGTPAERTVVRHAAAALDPGVVATARIAARHYLVIGSPAQSASGVRRDRGLWELQGFVASVAARLAARHDPLAGYQISGFTSGSGHLRIGPPGANSLLSSAVANALGDGFGLRSARVLSIGGGLVDLVVRMREDQLLDTAAQNAIATIFPPSATRAPVPLHFLTIEAPDGTAVAYGGTYVSGGTWSYGGDTGTAPVPRSFPRSLWQAPTDLVVHVIRTSGPVSRRKRTFHIVCGGTPPAEGTRCARVLADRWALLVPVVPGMTCGAVSADGWTVSVQGIFAGRPVDRGYDGCFAATVQRWQRFLHV